MNGEITITLVLRVADGSIAGRAVAESGEAREFSGFIGLVAALDALVPSLTPPAPTVAGGPTDTPGGNTR